VERVLSLRELNRALLARQLLLERAELSAVDAVERIAGMQAQWAPSPYVGLWSRVAGFERAELEEAYASGEVLRVVLMRGTVHLVTARQYSLFAHALTVAPAPWIRADAHELARRVGDAVHAFAAEPRTRKEVEAWLAEEHGVAEAGTLGLWYAVRLHGRLVYAGASGAWKAPRSPLFVAREPDAVDGAEARAELVRSYLAAFGPASRADLAEWSGARVRDLEPALAALEPLERFRTEEGRDLLDLPGAPLPGAETPAPVRFLPKWDSVLLAHADRRRVLPEAWRKAVIGKTGDVYQTFLVDGSVAGTWKAERGRVSLQPFAPLPREARREVEDEAARLEAWLA
jgi:hypothetical protein